MAAIDLTQAEADELMSVDKHRISDEAVPYPYLDKTLQSSCGQRTIAKSSYSTFGVATRIRAEPDFRSVRGE